MHVPRTRRALLSGAAALGIVLGAAGITAAATGSGSAGGEADHEQEPSYTSSITAPENASLDGLATITATQAGAAAASATGGTAGPVELENENGNVVYGVTVTLPDGSTLDVKVDAGNGKVLAKETDDDNTVPGDHAKGEDSTHGATAPEQPDDAE